MSTEFSTWSLNVLLRIIKNVWNTYTLKCFKQALNDSLGLVPLINRRKLHIVTCMLVRKCLDGLVPPYFSNYFNLNSSVHAVATRRCDDIHITKVNLETAKRSFYFTGATEFNRLPSYIKSTKSFIEFSEDVKDIFLKNYAM